MRHRLLFFVVLSLFLTVVPGPAWSDDKADVAAATRAWGEIFVDDNPDRILALYAPDAVLWGTLSPTVRQGPAPLREYFVAAFKALPGHRVTFGDQLIRIYGSTAINTGYYAFTYVKDGQTRTIPARYSFVYVKGDKGWLIVDHHSSAVPPPPQ